MAKKQTTLEKLKKKMEKLEAIHEKEDAIFEEINELLENDALTDADKEAILHKNSMRFYGL